MQLEIRLAFYDANTGAPAGPRLWKAAGNCPIQFNFPASREGMEEAKKHLAQLQKHIDSWNTKSHSKRST